MTGPSVIRRHFRDFKGLNQAASDLDREIMYAEVAENVQHLRRGDIIKRQGCVPQGDLYENMGAGMHVVDLNKSVQIKGTGFQEGGDSGETNNPSGSVAWSNESNAETSNGSYATAAGMTASTTTEWLYVRNFGLEVPVDAVISGVEVRAEISVASSTADAIVYAGLTTDSGTTIIESEATESTTFTTTDKLVVLGGQTNKFTVNNLSPTEVNASTFGVGIYLFNSSAGPVTYQVDALTVQVYYSVSTDSEELLAMGSTLCRKKTGSITIANSSGNVGTFYILPTASGYQVGLLENSSALPGWPKTYNTGASPGTIGDLYTDINAESGWSMTATPIARVDGAVSSGTSITVDASPQTFSKHDQVGFLDDDLGVTVWRHIHEITGTPSFELDLEASVADNEWLGLGREPVSSIEQVSVTLIASGSSRTYEVSYFEGVPNLATTEHLNSALPGAMEGGLINSPFIDPSHTGTPEFRNFSFVNARGNSYFAVPFFKARGLDRNVVSGQTELNVQNTGLWKYDGVQVHLAGLPQIPTAASPLTNTTGGSMTSSAVYKYRFQFSYEDGNGNFIDGPLTDEYSVTMGGSDTAVSLSFNFNLDETLFPIRHADIASSTANTNVATVSAGHGLIPGIPVIVWDNDASKYVTRRVVDTTRTTVTLDGATFGANSSGLADTSTISQLKVVIWRTEADGTIFYLKDEIPIAPSQGGIVHKDIKADTGLGESLIEPDRFPDLFPKLAYLCTHQGLIVGSGNPDDPEVVYFGDALNPESSPSSTSNFRVTGGDTAKVTAIASDNDDMLAVFKRNSYFNIVGDLDSLSFQRLTVSEFDYGCPAHHAIVKVDSALLFPSTTGFKAIAGGALVNDFGDRLLIDFSNNYYEQEIGQEINGTEDDKLVIRRAVAAYDSNTKQYVCYIPKEDGVPGIDGTLEPEAASPVFVYNTVRDSWYTWELPQQNNMAGGLVAFKDNLWWQARTYNSGLFGQVHKRRNSGLAYDYYDDNTAVEMTLRMSWDSMEAPASWFRPLFLKVYRFEPSGLSELVSPIGFDLTVNEYRNYNESTKYTQATRRFSTSHKQRRFKMKSGKASAISLEFLQPTAEEAGAISGYELQVALPYDATRLQTRGESNS